MPFNLKERVVGIGYSGGKNINCLGGVIVGYDIKASRYDVVFDDGEKWPCLESSLQKENTKENTMENMMENNKLKQVVQEIQEALNELFPSTRNILILILVDHFLLNGRLRKALVAKLDKLLDTTV